MIYGADRIVQMPVMQLYDTGLMQQAVENARYMYDKAEKRMDDFYEKYGEFMSPFQKDMDRYNQIVGGVKNVVDQLYASGEDPLRTASGRAKLAAAMRSINPAEFAAMKANAKMGYAYLDAAQKLRSQGKYSEAQELFDIVQNGGQTMGAFATLDPTTGRFNTWDRSAPIEATTLRDLTQDAYKGRTARILTENDFNDPRLAGYKYDPKYEWTGYLYSDLMKNAPGASLALAGDPRAAFFREQARQMVIARGEEPTAAAVEKQFQKNIADANTWALIDPDRKANEFALDDYRTRNDIRAHRAKAAIDYEYKHKDDQDPTDNIDDGYSLLKDVYVTTLAKGAGLEYLPQGGVDINLLPKLLRTAEKRQKEAISSGKNVLDATGQFISTDKINGIIPSAGKNGRGYFLSAEAIKMLRTEDAVRTSFKGWSQKGNRNNSGAIKTYRNNMSKQIADALSAANGKKGFYVKAVPTVDKNGNNIYSMVGDDNKWHTYARMKIYLSDGNKTTSQTLVGSKPGTKGTKIEKDGIELLLPIGLQSNEGKASPDLSISARERVGIKAYDTVKKWIGKDQDADFPWGNHIIKNETSLQNE